NGERVERRRIVMWRDGPRDQANCCGPEQDSCRHERNPQLGLARRDQRYELRLLRFSDEIPFAPTEQPRIRRLIDVTLSGTLEQYRFDLADIGHAALLWAPHSTVSAAANLSHVPVRKPVFASHFVVLRIKVLPFGK